jgi:NAD(P)-dependent dehydrogenase (short-subunit alcohol dehydrogenase family)
MNTKVVLITGALTGIGSATALAFAKGGARLIVSGRRDDAGAKLVKKLRESGAGAEYIRADVPVVAAWMSLSTMRVRRAPPGRSPSNRRNPMLLFLIPTSLASCSASSMSCG